MKEQEVIDMGWKGYVEQLESELTHVDVGILSKDGSESVDGGINLAKLATVHEYGTQIQVTDKMRMYLRATGLPLKKETTEITIPARPAFRQTFDQQEPELAQRADELDKAVMTGKSTMRNALSELGQMHRQGIQQNMKEGDFEPNHPYTLEKKKPKTQPLMNTGRMRQAIDYEVG